MRTTVVVVGGGQAGLAMSRCLTDRSIDHVILERGSVAHSWRTERWDSLRLLTPNWLSRLPGHAYAGPDPDGFMTAAEVVRLLDGYRASFGAPVVGGCRVDRVETRSRGFRVHTSHGPWDCDAVVVATGACSTPRIPGLAAELPAGVHQLSPIAYRNPEGLDGGPVLVVGASASGVQLADELARSGRDVTIAVGEHTRMPRTYRQRDIHWWMDRIGLLDLRIDEVPDPAKARRSVSSQLVGTPERRSLDLAALMALGVRVVGRLAGVAGHRAQCSGALANTVRSADLKLHRLLDLIDERANELGLDREVGPPDRPGPTPLPEPVLEVDLRTVATVVWATGFRPSYPWLEPDLLDRTGAIRHDRGVMARPGMVVLGLPFERRRKSAFLGGVGDDAIELADHLVAQLDLARYQRAA